MERRRLKSILIIILALANAFLGLNLVQRNLAEEAAWRQGVERLADLFAVDGILLPPEAVSRRTPPPAVLLERDEEREDAAAALFLGGETGRIREEGVRRFARGEASAEFRADGTFVVTGLAAADGAAVCREFCRLWSYAPPETVPADGEVSVPARYGGAEVCNCAVTFVFSEGALREVSGTLLPRTGREAPLEPLSASGALTAVQNVRRENRAVVSAIEGMDLCWALCPDAVLAPAWRIQTDTVVYYVNCATGGVESG